VRVLVALGVAAVAAGFAVLVDRGLAGALDLSSAVVTAVGLLGILQGLRYASERRGRDRRTTDLGEPERRDPATVPGTDLDRRIARATLPGRRGRGAKNTVRSRVRSLAVRAVARGRDLSRDRAEDLVEDGEWTDDRTAAAFLTRSISYPLRVQLRGGLPRRSTFRMGLTAATDGIDRLADGERIHPSPPDGSENGGTDRRSDPDRRVNP
jgi:hypothetical protein